jgi:hypothetical protein
MTWLSEEYSAAAGGKNLFTQPLIFFETHRFRNFAKRNCENDVSQRECPAAAGGRRLFIPSRQSLIPAVMQVFI